MTPNPSHGGRPPWDGPVIASQGVDAWSQEKKKSDGHY